VAHATAPPTLLIRCLPIACTRGVASGAPGASRAGWAFLFSGEKVPAPELQQQPLPNDIFSCYPTIMRPQKMEVGRFLAQLREGKEQIEKALFGKPGTPPHKQAGSTTPG